jgi:hypothetical protein
MFPARFFAPSGPAIKAINAAGKKKEEPANGAVALYSNTTGYSNTASGVNAL